MVASGTRFDAEVGERVADALLESAPPARGPPTGSFADTRRGSVRNTVRSASSVCVSNATSITPSIGALARRWA